MEKGIVAGDQYSVLFDYNLDEAASSLNSTFGTVSVILWQTVSALQAGVSFLTNNVCQWLNKLLEATDLPAISTHGSLIFSVILYALISVVFLKIVCRCRTKTKTIHIDPRNDHLAHPEEIPGFTNHKSPTPPAVTQAQNHEDLSYRFSVFDLAKTGYEAGHAEAVINIVERLHYDVNSTIPSNGLTLLLCACLSGQRKLINYMIQKGGDVTRTTKAGDTALYLATFGVLSSVQPDLQVLEDIIKAGCNVNAANLGGYTALHRAAGHGNLNVIQILLKYGADIYQASASGIYPIDSAINAEIMAGCQRLDVASNMYARVASIAYTLMVFSANDMKLLSGYLAGNLDAAELLKISLPNPHVWDMIEPHTPPHITLGLQSPQRKHLIESSRRHFAPRIG